jgi:dephospho-CoA kinase
MRTTPLIRLGITGTIGSGKSTVGKILEELGVPVIDTDKIVHQILDNNQKVQELIGARFGKDALIDTGNGELKVDRRSLGLKVFNDEQARKDLEAIVHPYVRQECRRLVEAFSGDTTLNVVATLVPLLFEAKAEKDYDEIWTVVANEDSIYRRLAERDRLSREEIAQRLQAQFTQERKGELAHRVIDNSKDLGQTRQQIQKYLAELLKQSDWKDL